MPFTPGNVVKSYIIPCFILLFTPSLLFSGQPAKIGKLLSKRLAEVGSQDPSVVLISLKDKGDLNSVQSFSGRSLVSEKSLQRRTKVRQPNALVNEDDLPLERSYVDAIRPNVISLRHELKWFNAVSAIATKDQIETIRNFPFVKEIELVGRWKKRQEDEKEIPAKKIPSVPKVDGATSLDYGTSFTQVNQINVPALHNLGIYGQGVVVGVFDNGFRLLTHQSFASMNIIAQHDFVDHKTSVVPNNPSTAFGSHGVNTLSTIGGYKPGQLIGPAFKSTFILARTENDSSETPVEEDNWAKAIEWADSIGIDVTSTSLGYLTYDAPYTSWTWQDMDGATTLITKAADHAVSLGIVVVNSAGNDAIARAGDPNTLIAPADGFDVITAGAVNSTGARASFSSFGPTFDGRIKPDVMAMGVNVKVASSTNPTGYGSSNGTSFSCPLTAGVAALLVCANPTLVPSDIANAMRQTADNSASPDNLLGWGIVNALDALNYNVILPIARIRGRIFNDINGNGIADIGDPNAAGVKVRLAGTMSESTYTNVLGEYTFDSLAIGSYTLSLETLSGWKQTFPDSSHAVALLHGTDTSGLSFGVFQLGTIHGTIFDDMNKNGSRDTSEGTAAGWRIHLTGPETLTVSTDSNGRYFFSNLIAGTYTISESSFAGWIQTLPPGNGAYNVHVRSGLDTTGLDFGSYYTPDSVYSVLDGWNLLSLPVFVSDPRKSTLYPVAASRAFKYAGSYVQIDSFDIGVGYWLKFPYAQNILIAGTGNLSDTADVKAGWNIIGGLSLPTAVSSIQQIPTGIVISQLYYYDGAYHVADSLRAHHGYWVKANANGKLAIHWPMSVERGAESRGNGMWKPPEKDNLAGFITLRIEDSRGRQQTLYVGDAGSTGIDLKDYELPPLPPDGAFDARFVSGRLLEFLPGESGQTKELPVLLQGGSGKLTVTWTMSGHAGSTYSFVEKAGKKIISEHRLVENTSFSLLPDGERRYAIVVEQLPRGYQLYQNYPNPFNPTTTIGFDLPEPAAVTLKIYNLLGQEVASPLTTQLVEAGHHSIEFDGRNLASGIYFYRIGATGIGAGRSFHDVRRMLILK